ncbi:amidohydrolase family protein [Nonomuraea sp. NN258]|nr:amidohydrolase family protein [Nonomuraea antri]
MNPGGHLAGAIAITGGRIVRVGTPLQVQPLVGPGTRVIRLGGRSVLPGINDSHLHGAWLGHRRTTPLPGGPLPEGPTSGGLPPVGPFHGGPTFAGPLSGDRSSGGLPVWGMAGPETSHASGAHPAAPDSGRLRTSEQRRAAILRTGDLLASLGITSYTEPGLGPGEDAGATGCFGTAVLEEYAQLAAEGLLRARVTALLLFGERNRPSSPSALLDGLRDFTPPADVPGWFRVAGVKIFADGVDGPEAALAQMIGAAARAGHQVAVNAMSGTATRAAATALARLRHPTHRHPDPDDDYPHRHPDPHPDDAYSDAPRSLAAHPDGRHYLIHAGLLDSPTLAAMAAAGIGLNTQADLAALPPHDVQTPATPRNGMRQDAGAPDTPHGGRTPHEARTWSGPQDTRTSGTTTAAWPVGDAVEAGVPLCLSSDAPALTPDWRHHVAAALSRRESGRRLTLDQALRAYTSTPARQDGAESWKGSLEPGKVADLCVLDTGLLDASPADVRAAEVVLTVVGGRIVHER